MTYSDNLACLPNDDGTEFQVVDYYEWPCMTTARIVASFASCREANDFILKALA